jgi:hypothetical protein
MKARENSLSVPMPEALLAYVRKQALLEERSQAAIVRRLVAEAAKRQQRAGDKRAA